MSRAGLENLRHPSAFAIFLVETLEQHFPADNSPLQGNKGYLASHRLAT